MNEPYWEVNDDEYEVVDIEAEEKLWNELITKEQAFQVIADNNSSTKMTLACYDALLDGIAEAKAIDVDQIIDEHIGEYLAARCQVLVSAEAMNQRRAHWIKRRGGKYVCSNCNMDALFDNTTCMVPSRFCPSCGRWMCGPIEDLTEESEDKE